MSQKDEKGMKRDKKKPLEELFEQFLGVDVEDKKWFYYDFLNIFFKCWIIGFNEMRFTLRYIKKESRLTYRRIFTLISNVDCFCNSKTNTLVRLFTACSTIYCMLYGVDMNKMTDYERLNVFLTAIKKQEITSCLIVD